MDLLEDLALKMESGCTTRITQNCMFILFLADAFFGLPRKLCSVVLDCRSAILFTVCICQYVNLIIGFRNCTGWWDTEYKKKTDWWGVKHEY